MWSHNKNIIGVEIKKGINFKIKQDQPVEKLNLYNIGETQLARPGHN